MSMFSKAVKSVAHNPLSLTGGVGALLGTKNGQGLAKRAAGDWYTGGLLEAYNKLKGNPPGTPPPPDTTELDKFAASMSGKGAADQQMLMNEAQTQKDLATGTATSNASARAKYLSDLGGILKTQQTNDFNAAAPGIMNDLNARGVYRSSGLGSAFARKEGELSAATSSKLAEQGINDSNANLTDLNNIQNNYLANRSGAIQRNLSVGDYGTQLEGGKLLGQATMPIAQPQGKSAAPLQGALGGAGVGATAGGPIGAAVGGVGGLVLGSQVGKKGK